MHEKRFAAFIVCSGVRLLRRILIGGDVGRGATLVMPIHLLAKFPDPEPQTKIMQYFPCSSSFLQSLFVYRPGSLSN